MSSSIGDWIQAIATLAILSYLFLGENKLFRGAEHIFVAMAAAHTVVVNSRNITDMAIRPGMSGQWWLFIPCILGIMLYARFFRGLSWIGRIPLGFTMGVGAALSIRGTIGANLINQIAATLVPLNSVNNILLVVGVVTTIMFFFYFKGTEKVGFIRVGSYIGRSFMMIAFGSSFGYTVMGRMSNFIGRLQFLFGTWIHLIK